MTMVQITPNPAAPANEPIDRRRGVNCILMGPSGTGKTHAIGTAVEARPDVMHYYVGLETGIESLLGYFADKGKPIPPNLHWKMIDTQVASFDVLMQNAQKINMMSFEALTKMNDPQRSKHNQLVTLLSTLNKFVSDRDGSEHGDVSKWGVDKALYMDGLTGLCNITMSLVIGGKPVRNQADWGVAQNQVEILLRMLCDGCACHFILLAHVEREVDPVLGGVKIMVQSLGKALSPKIPAMFSDVILTVREGTKWTWDTASPSADLKTRNLPVKAGLDPSFRQIFDRWEARMKAAYTEAGVEDYNKWTEASKSAPSV